MTASEFLSVNPESVVRAVITQIVRTSGLKRGLATAAATLGVSERWARGLYYGEKARVSAAVYLRAHEAQMRLLAERRAALLRELQEIEASLGGSGHDVGDHGADPVRAGALGDAHG